jgi:hypothetical protein
LKEENEAGAKAEARAETRVETKVQDVQRMEKREILEKGCVVEPGSAPGGRTQLAARQSRAGRGRSAAGFGSARSAERKPLSFPSMEAFSSSCLVSFCLVLFRLEQKSFGF